jgi:hypothetical protein
MAAEAGHVPNRIYIGQDGNFHNNGAVIYDGAEAAVPEKASISAAAGSANVCLVTFQVKDGGGNNVASPTELDVWLSDAATGIGLTGTTASGTVAAGASGTDLGDLTVKKSKRVLTDATGKYILSITDTGKTGFYPCCAIPGTGKAQVGAQLVTGNYG